MPEEWLGEKLPPPPPPRRLRPDEIRRRPFYTTRLLFSFLRFATNRRDGPASPPRPRPRRRRRRRICGPDGPATATRTAAIIKEYRIRRRVPSVAAPLRRRFFIFINLFVWFHSFSLYPYRPYIGGRGPRFVSFRFVSFRAPKPIPRTHLPTHSVLVVVFSAFFIIFHPSPHISFAAICSTHYSRDSSTVAAVQRCAFANTLK